MTTTMAMDTHNQNLACETRANLAPTQIIAYEEAVRLRDFESSTTEQVLNQAPTIYFTYVHMERWGVHAIGNDQQQSIMPSQSQTHDFKMHTWRRGRSPDVAIPTVMEFADEQQAGSFKELHIVGELRFAP